MLFTEVTREEYGDIREQEGREDGIEIGRADGIEIGRADGIEIGRADGVETGIEVAKKVFKLHGQGKSIEEIAKACNLSKDSVNQILT